MNNNFVYSDIVVVMLGPSALDTALRTKELFPGSQLHAYNKEILVADVYIENIAKHLAALYAKKKPIIAICAAGIIIRCLSPYLNDKLVEPPVIAVSENGKNIVPLLGGHSGANQIAKELALSLGGHAAITTAGETTLGISLDCPPDGWSIEPGSEIKEITTALLAKKPVALTDKDGFGTWLTDSSLSFESSSPYNIVISESLEARGNIIFRPHILVLGIGCERGVSKNELKDLIQHTLAGAGLSILSVACIASIDVKADEIALIEVAQDWNSTRLPIKLFSAQELELQKAKLLNPSQIVFEAVGCHGVAEAAALSCTGPHGRLIVPKTKSAKATCAVAIAPHIITVKSDNRTLGILTIVGVGPGNSDWRSPAATNALLKATDLVGYSAYLDLVKPSVTGQIRHSFDLGEEKARVKKALELASAGRNVALISSGDAGIYGMAALVFELLNDIGSTTWARIEIIVEPGISAFQAAAARAGAPLGHDFCAISLSDLMTPWSVIEKRLQAAANADFVVALYNPASKKRRIGLKIATEIFSKARPSSCPVLIARELGRPNEKIIVTTLEKFKPETVDMLTIIIIGARNTRLYNNDRGSHMYTPRGYIEI